MSSGAWDNPPPPGTMEDQCNRSSKDKQNTSASYGKTKESHKRYSSRSRSHSRSSEEPPRSCSRSRSRSRSRGWHSKSSSYHHRRRRTRRSRSTSYKRHSHKRKSSSYKSTTRGKYSRSRSRSCSRPRHHNHHHHHHRRSFTRSRSHSRSHSGSNNSWTSSSYSDRESSLYRNNRSKNYVPEVPKTQEYLRKVYSKQSEVPVQENTFKNDGSFLEMFKKMQEEKAAEEKKTDTTEQPSVSTPEVKKNLPIFGKRRGGKVLKTGLVQKLKNPNEVEEEPKDAWSVYMKEVKRYKEACCDDDSKTRPLVK